MAHGPRKKALDVGDNADHVTQGSGLWLGGSSSSAILHMGGRDTRRPRLLTVTVLRPWRRYVRYQSC